MAGTAPMAAYCHSPEGERVQNRHPGREIQDFKIQSGFPYPNLFPWRTKWGTLQFIHPRGTDLGQGERKRPARLWQGRATGRYSN